MADRAQMGLLVDWGGVMTSSVFDAFEAFGRAEGIDVGTVREAFATDPRARALLGDYERGTMPGPAFERAFADVLGLEEHEGLVGRLFAGLRQDRRMQDAVAAFRRAGVRTGLLSNSWGTGESYDRARFDELFDVLVVSGELGVRKPEPEIYAIAVERMGLPAERLVFVDDLPGNLKPARALGMATVVHRDAAATLAELEALLGVALPAEG